MSLAACCTLSQDAMKPQVFRNRPEDEKNSAELV